MAMMSQEKILECIMRRLHSLKANRESQMMLLRFAEEYQYSLRDAEQSLSHYLVFGGATSPGLEWPLNWPEAKAYLASDQIQSITDAYRNVIEGFPQELKESHAALFA